MKLIFLDTETTGLNPEMHRTLEIAFKVVDSWTGKSVISYEAIVSQNEAVWAEADPLSLAFTGFAWEDILKGKTEMAVASEITYYLNKLSLRENGGVFICQNPSFDRAFFNQMINPDMQEHYGWPYHWLDLASMYWAIHLMQDREAALHFKESDLSKDEIAKHFGLEPEHSPHRAMNGVNHLMSCYEALFGRFAPA